MQFRKSENTFRGLARKHKIIWNFIFFRFWFILSLFSGCQVFIERLILFERIFERRLSLRLMSKRLILFFFMSRSTLCDDLPNKTPCYMTYVTYIMWCMFAYIWQWANNRLNIAFYRFYAQNIHLLWLNHMAHCSVSYGADVIHMAHIIWSIYI